jgi:hypothetical protein
LLREPVASTPPYGAWDGTLYGGCAFLGAFLLFVLEPLIAKMVLPLYGGSAGVWSAAYLFFTLTLLCGYLYAHVLSRLTWRRQVVIHGMFLLLAGLCLPIRVPSNPLCAGCAPPLSLLAVLIQRAGIPFLALSATSPLLQSWWARRAEQSREPYVFFALSNLGSVAALIAYPFAVEPFFGLRLQTLAWTGGYVVFALLLMAIAATLFRVERLAEAQPLSRKQEPTRSQTQSPSQSPSPSQSKTRAKDARPTARQNTSQESELSTIRPLDIGPPDIRLKTRAEWILISALQVLLLLALTNHLSTDVAPIPFIWTMPLALYLVAFVVVFAGLRRLRAQSIVAALPLVLLPVLVLLATRQKVALIPYVILQLAAFFILMVGLTARLASLRPPAAQLTEFYVWIAAGGALGGMAVVFLSPYLFRTVAEYPIAIVLACLLLPSAVSAIPGWRGNVLSVLDVVLGILLVLAVFAMVRWAPLDGGDFVATQRLWLAIAAGAAFVFFQRRLRFAAAIAAVLVMGGLLPDRRGESLLVERNFFGRKQVMVDPSQRFHFLVSGPTLHGVESLEAGSGCEPLAYYSRSGPLGDIFQTGAARVANRDIGVIGMGIGSAAGYRQPGERWTFYELDPGVAAIAQDTNLFSFLQTCAPDASVVLGDGRLRLSQQTSPRYALLILDAYLGDHVPVHLLTREALASYLARTENDGIIAFHISNRNFFLAPVLSGLAQDAELEVLERDDLELSPEDSAGGKMESRWIVMTRKDQMPAALRADPRWHAPQPDPNLPLWTDDYSSLARVLRF